MYILFYSFNIAGYDFRQIVPTKSTDTQLSFQLISQIVKHVKSVEGFIGGYMGGTVALPTRMVALVKWVSFLYYGVWTLF